MLNETDRPSSGAVRAPAAARRIWLGGLLVAGLALGLPADARAGPSVAVTSAELEVRDDPEPGLYLNAQFEFEPSPAIEDAVRRGIPVYFAIDFELVRTRWYWFNKPLASPTLEYRLSYSPLTRQFRLSSTDVPVELQRQFRLSRGALAQPFETLAEALATIRNVRQWRVAGPEPSRSPEHLLARVRLRLDTSMLPKPFQVDSLTNHDWALTSDWHPVRVGVGLNR